MTLDLDDLKRRRIFGTCEESTRRNQRDWHAMIDELRQHREFRQALASRYKTSDYGDPCEYESCRHGRAEGWDPMTTITRFYVCPICRNKRCPHCEDHRFKCTGSNEPNQVGVLIETEQLSG